VSFAHTKAQSQSTSEAKCLESFLEAKIMSSHGQKKSPCVSDHGNTHAHTHTHTHHTHACTRTHTHVQTHGQTMRRWKTERMQTTKRERNTLCRGFVYVVSGIRGKIDVSHGSNETLAPFDETREFSPWKREDRSRLPAYVHRTVQNPWNSACSCCWTLSGITTEWYAALNRFMRAHRCL